MHQYNTEAPFGRIAIHVAGSFQQSNQGNQYLLIAMDYCTKWLGTYSIPNQEALTVVEALVTNFFCHCGVQLEIHSDQSHNFESCLTRYFAIHKLMYSLIVLPFCPSI
jgi:hypothetical protein